MNRKITGVLAALTAAMLLLTSCNVKLPGSSSSSAPSSSTPPAPPSSSAPPEPEYSKGETTEEGYSNSFWNISFTPPDGIMMADEEMLKQFMNIGGDAMGMDEEALGDASDALFGAYEMMAFDGATGTSLAIISQTLPISGMGEDLALQAMLEGVKASSPQAVLEAENDGKPVEETLCGIKFKKLAYSMKIEGVPDLYQVQYIHIQGKQMLMLVTGYGIDTKGSKEAMESMLAALTPINEVDEPQA